MDTHHAYNPSVMNLNSGNGIVHNQPSPLRVNRRRLLQDRKDAFDQPDPAVGFRNRETEPASCRHQPGADVPELNDILRSATELVSALRENADGLSDCAVIGDRCAVKA